jgi:predicted small secreted protein
MTGRIRLQGTSPRFDARGFAFGSIAAALLAVALLSGCNTAKGIGDDVEEAAEEVGDAID